MPFSDAEGKNVAADWYRQVEPDTVIDIGAGCGTYAKLMRETPDRVMAGLGATVVRHLWRDHWTAIEAWEPYVAHFGLRELYNAVRIADARDLDLSDLEADLIVAGDVLEHMTRADARALIARMKTAAANLIVSIPVLHLDQGDVFGNPYERHIDHWTADAMRNELGDGVRAEWVGQVLAYFWWQRPA